MTDIYCKIPQFLVYKGLNSTNSVRIRFSRRKEYPNMKYSSHLSKTKSIRPPFGWKIALNLTYMTVIKENGIKQFYRADERNTLLEPSLKVLFIKFGWGATSKNPRMGSKMLKMKMAALPLT